MNLTFLSSVLGLSLRAVLFAVLIPKLGVYGYFVSLLKPSLLLLAAASFFYKLYEFLAVQTTISHLLLLALCGILLALTTLGLFIVTGILKRGELTGTE